MTSIGDIFVVVVETKNKKILKFVAQRLKNEEIFAANILLNFVFVQSFCDQDCRRQQMPGRFRSGLERKMRQEVHPAKPETMSNAESQVWRIRTGVGKYHSRLPKSLKPMS